MIAVVQPVAWLVLAVASIHWLLSGRQSSDGRDALIRAKSSSAG